MEAFVSCQALKTISSIGMARSSAHLVQSLWPSFVVEWLNLLLDPCCVVITRHNLVWRKYQGLCNPFGSIGVTLSSLLEIFALFCYFPSLEFLAQNLMAFVPFKLSKTTGHSEYNLWPDCDHFGWAWIRCYSSLLECELISDLQPRLCKGAYALPAFCCWWIFCIADDFRVISMPLSVPA